VRFGPVVAGSLRLWRERLRSIWPVLAAVELLSFVASSNSGDFPLDNQAPSSPLWLVFSLVVVLPASLVGEGTSLGLYGAQTDSGLRAALRHGLKQIGPLFIYYFLIGIFLTALAVPVLIAWRLHQQSALLVGAAMGAIALWLFGRWFVAPALIVVHGRPATTSFRESAALIRGHTMTAVGLNALFLGLTLVPQLISWILTTLLATDPQDPGPLLLAIDLILALILAPLAFALLSAARVTLAGALRAGPSAEKSVV
jgi:hypothetical protein